MPLPGFIVASSRSSPNTAKRANGRSSSECATARSIPSTSRWGRGVTGSRFRGAVASPRRPFNRDMTLKSLRKMREYGFTAFSGVPTIAYRGFADGRPVLDFTAADAQMALAKELGFLAVVTYGSGVSGINAYYQDTAAMTKAGFR
jgi:hypothetical protein